MCNTEMAFTQYIKFLRLSIATALLSPMSRTPKMKVTLSRLNSLTRDEFVCVVGPVFEHSPWIADAAWEKRPFADLEALHQALMNVVESAGEDKQVKLIQAHPDLAGRAALAGTLTAGSNREQASAGLDKLAAEEIALFQKNNQAYREKFGFPFVICARLNKKEAILKGFELRLSNTREQEIRTALGEIGKITRLRLRDLIVAG
jgi:2-oxo-4-hydroxy-4-carboxy-5-ureidoimidazoline decarboxylase